MDLYRIQRALLRSIHMPVSGIPNQGRRCTPRERAAAPGVSVAHSGVSVSGLPVQLLELDSSRDNATLLIVISVRHLELS